MTTLNVRSGGTTRSYPVSGALTIGRATDNDVVISASDVSRHHATLAAAGDLAVLVDLGSANGTAVNGVPVAPNVPVTVRPGDVISIASNSIELVAAAPSTPVPPFAQPPAAAPAPAFAVTPARSKGPARNGLAIVASIAVVVAFLAFLLTNAVDTKLLEAGFYKGVLDHAHAYDRSYSDIAADPALSGEVVDLTCGGTGLFSGGLGSLLPGNLLPGGLLPGNLLPSDVAGPVLVTAVQAFVPVSVLRAIVETSIDRLIDYLKRDTALNVSLDITPVVAGVNLIPKDVGDFICPGMENLVKGKFVHEVAGSGGNRYFLGPPADITGNLADTISFIRFASWAAGWGRPLGLFVVVALVVFLGVLFFPNYRLMLRWMGAPLLIAGGAGFFGWLIGREILRQRILDVTLGDSPTLPGSFQQLFRDVLSTASADLTPTFWAPCAVAAAVGAVLMVASLAARPRSST